MKACVLYSITLILISSTSWAAKIKLPLGGKISLDEKTWSVRKADDIAPGKSGSLIFINKKHTELMGYSFGGTIQPEGACGSVSKKTASEWQYCEKEFPLPGKISRQITLQRKLGNKIFQSYVLSFNIEKNKDAEYSKILKDMLAYLEKNK